MILGNGMLARAFREFGYAHAADIIFASGVSDSRCAEAKQFSRERALLEQALPSMPPDCRFVYFGTCSVRDPAELRSPYVLHKLSMEQLVLSHAGGIVFRLPQIAGPNAPANTLIAVVCKAIREGRQITAWRDATRNIVDVNDAVQTVDYLLRSGRSLPRIVNVASPFSSTVAEVIASAEAALGTSAIVDWQSKGAHYDIDVSFVQPAFDALGIKFDGDYLTRVIQRYYR